MKKIIITIAFAIFLFSCGNDGDITESNDSGTDSGTDTGSDTDSDVDSDTDTDTGLCDGVTCGTNATCDPTDGICYCDLGHDGDPYVECTDFDACDPNPCFTGVTCTDDAPPSMGYECGDCPTGYVGDGEICTCDIAGGYIEYPASSGICIDDPCDPDPCNGHATSCDVNGSSDFTCNCDTNYDGATCDTCAVGYEDYPACTVIPAPVISGLAIDCSVHLGFCSTGWTYPVSWNFTDATSFDTALELISGSTTLGFVDPASGALSVSPKTVDYTLGNQSPSTVRLTVTVYGSGGEDSDYIDIDYY